MASVEEQPSRAGAAGLAFVGFLIIGLGAGILTGQVATYLLIGLGAGFVGMAIARAITGQW